MRAYEIMTPQVITVGADTTIVEAIKTMLRHQISGLPVVEQVLDGVPDIHFSKLTSIDVVRHKLVGKIVDAYERYDARAPRRG